MRFLIKATAYIVSALALTLGFAWCFGHVRFSDQASDALVQFGALFGIDGDEGLEDFYLEVTLLISLVAAVSIVWAVSRLLIKKHRRPV
jgi:hypothetical protein